MLYTTIGAPTSWRALHSSSNLCCVLSQVCNIQDPGTEGIAGYMVPSQYISTGFRIRSNVCFQETLQSMKDKAGAITRRSAGIPTLMASIIAAEPEAGGKLLARAMKDLISEASLEAEHTNIEESRLPQVHALNCIKEIFTTSKLSVASEAYIAQGLELAGMTLNSNMQVISSCLVQ
jgi:hypothetical protein